MHLCKTHNAPATSIAAFEISLIGTNLLYEISDAFFVKIQVAKYMNHPVLSTDLPIISENPGLLWNGNRTKKESRTASAFFYVIYRNILPCFYLLILKLLINCSNVPA